MKMALVCFLLLVFSALPTHISSHSDEEALLSFKHSLISQSNNLLSDWSPHHSFCNWTGVVCSSRHQRVASLNLTGMSLLGTISPFLGNLSFLRILDFANNSLQGQIPPQLGRLFRLRILVLAQNKLEGSIPSTLGDCGSLQVLSLSYNNLSGSIPSQLGYLPHLEALLLGANQLTGTVPTSLGNLSSLISFQLMRNKLQGKIPIELGMLTKLEVLSISTNNLIGVIPAALSNCTLLHNLSLYYNQLTGHIPWEIGKLRELQHLLLEGNQLIGEIPSSLTNCTQLQVVDLASNQLSGKVPLEFGNLHQLLWLNLWDNHLVSQSNNFSILTALTNCSSLQFLSLSLNYFTGMLPSSISQLSSKLTDLELFSNKIEGNIPSGISNLTMLTYLDLSDNRFNGTIPSPFSQLPNLESLFLAINNLYGNIPNNWGQAKHLGQLVLSENMLSGKIPNSLGDLTQLRVLALDHNQLSGKIPGSLGRCETLEVLDLSHNKLRGNIPPELANLKNLQLYFNISDNLLQGSLLEMSKMVMVQAIDVSLNKFSSEIPASLSSCTNLQYLNLSWNSLYGPIQTSLTQLKNLLDIDLSNNNLSGAIPMAFGEMETLQHINLSSNKLTGEVPEEGVFATIDESTIMGNLGLCGTLMTLSPCSHSKHKQPPVSKKVIIPVVVGIAIFIMSFLLFIISYRWRQRKIPNLNVWPIRIAYEELLDATGGFSEANLIGIGSFGSIYKGILKNGIDIAVKVLNLQDENALRTFDRECNVLKRVRHRNVIKIISTCSNLDFKALVLPFMSNGSLGRWLYPEGGDECKLNLIDRLRIAKEIAQGMEYLHHHCFVQVIHCDLKPNNVLLGDDLTPCVADFGITKLLFGNSMNSFSSTNALNGSIGYIAPEYGMGGMVSTKGDVYSYGILLLELLTRRRPTNDMFVEGINLPKWVGMNFPNKITEVVDDNLLRDVNESDLSMVLSCLTQFMQVGLACTRELPQERPDMMEITKRLEKIAITFLGTRSLQLPIDILSFLESTNDRENIELGKDDNWSTSTS
ncbi:hypothetical protein SUGI_0876620 [Cryptomeria japonica]|uniref:LRR receptor-like serine/threonine-protein kinase FLS2 n=1 Tax=Cryptomeria japonica TaxID=3369 RepID=UPI0024149F7A|nr:LRR receptor-like serine/threonine-protein kinase FLS2 [Cryptomeria japonica]GLJ42333.1 hypothetical protein SUGI_0876620 [Cryptomeria japonica]